MSVENKAYWVSWVHPFASLTGFDLKWPWWKQGRRIIDRQGVKSKHPVLFAAVQAADDVAARKIIRDSYDSHVPLTDFSWRFCEEKPAGWSPYDTGFKKLPDHEWTPIASRATPPPRRPNVTCEVQWTSPAGPDTKLIVTFGLDSRANVREVFCASFRAHSDLCALANDSCVILSTLLQCGYPLHDIAKSMSENRAEGETSGPPASLIGAIVRKALEVDQSKTML